MSQRHKHGSSINCTVSLNRGTAVVTSAYGVVSLTSAARND